MSSPAFDLRSLLPQRGPVDAFQNLASQSEAFSAAFIWGTILFGFVVFVWVLVQWARVWWRTACILKLLQGVTVESAATDRERLRQQGGALWREFDDSLVEEHDPLTGRVWVKRTVDAAQVFNERTLAHGLIHSRLIAATPGLLTAVGVLGAFAGLQLGISGLRLENPQEVEQSVQPLIRGVAIKFASSIWGILSSIIFNVLEKLVEANAWKRIRQAQARVDAVFPRYTAEAALSRLQTSSAESEKILRGLATAIGGQMQQALAQVGQATSQAIGDAMKPAVATLTEAAHRLTSDLSTGSAEGLSQGIATAAQRLQESLEQVADRYNQQFIDLSRRLTESFEGLQSPVARLSEVLGQQDAALAHAVRRLEAHAELAGTLSGTALTMRGAVDGLVALKGSWEVAAARNETAASAQERAAQSNERVAAQLGTVSDGLNEFRQNIDVATRVIGSFGVPMRDLQGLLARLPEAVREIEITRKEGDEERQVVMRQITSELAQTIRQAAERLSGHASVAESLRVAAERMGDATRYLESFADQLQDAAARHERAADAAENAAHSNARVADVLESMPVHLGSMNESLTEAADSLKETASLTVQGYAKGAEQQQRFLQGLSEGLRRFAESIQNVLQGYGNEMQAQTRARIQEFAEETADILNKLETFQNQLDQNVEFVEVAVNRLRNGSGHNGSRH